MISTRENQHADANRPRSGGLSGEQSDGDGDELETGGVEVDRSSFARRRKMWCGTRRDAQRRVRVGRDAIARVARSTDAPYMFTVYNLHPVVPHSFSTTEHAHIHFVLATSEKTTRNPRGFVVFDFTVGGWQVHGALP